MPDRATGDETASMKYGLGGGGKVPVKRAVKVRCEPCAGSGSVACPVCYGSGRVLRVD
jgi:hypothetical protein